MPKPVATVRDTSANRPEPTWQNLFVEPRYPAQSAPSTWEDDELDLAERHATYGGIGTPAP
jgi:hypothetical protein